jgi:hypothetical protein
VNNSANPRNWCARHIAYPFPPVNSHCSSLLPPQYSDGLDSPKNSLVHANLRSTSELPAFCHAERSEARAECGEGPAFGWLPPTNFVILSEVRREPNSAKDLLLSERHQPVGSSVRAYALFASWRHSAKTHRVACEVRSSVSATPPHLGGCKHAFLPKFSSRLHRMYTGRQSFDLARFFFAVHIQLRGIHLCRSRS